MSFAGGVSLTATRRRRIIYCAWWTAPPRRQPFQPPDATGSAATREEALAAAARAAGRPLPEIEGIWAGAYVRLGEGKPPFFTRARRAPRVDVPVGDWSPSEGCPFAALGVPASSPLPVVRRAFRLLALRHHPDRGGDPEAFQRVRRAYEEARRRL